MVNLLRVFVVDDSALFRQVIIDAVQKMPTARLSGFAKNGQEAIEKIEKLQPDVVTLDVEMPIMNGFEALEIISKRWPKIKVIMVTSLNQYSVKHTVEALEGNAFSFVTKPDIGGAGVITDELTRIVQGIHAEQFGTVPTSVSPKTFSPTPVVQTTMLSKPLLVAIGISTGGPNALNKLIPMIPSDFQIPILIVQHMPAGFTKALADSLNTNSTVTVKEAVHGDKLMPRTVYIAPGGKQMKVVRSEIGIGQIVITDDPPEQFCKPSVDYLYRSLAAEFPARVLAVIMTGMGSDGSKGLLALKEKGAYVIGQNKESCTVYGMPGAANALGVVDEEVHLDQLKDAVLRRV